MNKVEAIKASRHGAICASLSTVINIVLFLIAKNTNATGALINYSDPGTIFFVAPVGMLSAYWMYRNSRVTAVAILYCASVTVLMAPLTTVELVWGLACIYFYGRAAQGAFAFHKLERLENPDYKATDKWAYIIFIPLVIVSTLGLGIIVLEKSGTMLPPRVLAKDEIHPKWISTLISHGHIGTNDSVDYFYSSDPFSVLNGSYIMTQDELLVNHLNEAQELLMFALSLSDITEVEMVTPGDAVNLSVHIVHTEDPDIYFILSLPTDRQGDQKFVDALRKK
jgi:hypothetical protein